MNNKAMWFNPRILRSPYSVPIWKDKSGSDIKTSLKTHPADWLRQFAAEGYNGVYLNAIFSKLLPSSLFPNAAGAGIDCLNRLVERAGKFNVKVHLILHEPRGLLVKDPFWRKHPDLKGQPFSFSQISAALDNAYYALCTSTPEVREYLESSSYNLFQRVPGLGGVLLITASEYHTHCYSHYPLPQKQFAEPDMAEWAKAKFICPRCARRSPAEVAAEIIALVHRGAISADPKAQVMAHTWSWYIVDPDPQRKLISLLPKGVALFSDWERGDKIKVQGRTYPVDEYCYAIVGPSPRFVQHTRLAQKNILRMFAKISINATHELRSVPYLPLPHILAKKMQRMRALGVKGFEGSLPFGAEMTPMTRLAVIMSRQRQPKPEDAVRELAINEFGAANSDAVIRAWRLFAQAWRNYPFSTPLLYWGPMNYATAWPFDRRLKKEKRIASWLPLPRDKDGHIKAGDNLETWVNPFLPADVMRAFNMVLAEWNRGVKVLESLCHGRKRPSHALLIEKQLAEHIGLSFGSTINIIQYCLFYRQFLASTSLTRRGGLNRKKGLEIKLLAIAGQELKTGLRDMELVRLDPRLGYHPEAQVHLFMIDDLKFKISLCKEICDLGVC